MTLPLSRRLLFVALVLSIGCFHLATLRDGHSWGDDFAQYILHARNIATGHPYQDTGYIPNPNVVGMGPPNYPPLTPLFLAPVYMVFGASLPAMKAAMVLFLMLALAALYFLFRDRLPPLWLALLIVLVGLSPPVWDYKDYIGSDYLFLALCLLCLALLDRLPASDHPTPRWVLDSCLAGVAIWLAYSTRSIGLILFPATLAYPLLRFHRIPRSFALTFAVAGALIGAQGLFIASDRVYLQETAAAVSWSSPVENARNYMGQMGVFWANGYFAPARIALYLTTLILAVVGLWQRRKERPLVFDVFLVFYLGVLLLYPFDQGTRFLFPLLPFVFFYALSTTATGFPALIRRAGPRLLLGVVALILLSYVGAYSVRDFGPERSGISQPEFLELCGYIRQNTSEQDRFIFRKPRALALLTGRSAATYNPSDRMDLMIPFMDSIQARYLIVANTPDPAFESDRSTLRPFLERHPASFETAFANRSFTLYRLRKPGEKP